MTYAEKLRNPLWQKKRLEILSRDKFTCTSCGDSETELQIHHKKYIDGKEPWEYDESDLITLCKHCHLVTEELKRENASPVVISKTKYSSENGNAFLAVIYTLNSAHGAKFFYYIDGQLSEKQNIKPAIYIEVKRLLKLAENLNP